MKTVMLLGGAGFIGRNLALEFLARDYNVLIFDRHHSGIYNQNCQNIIDGLDSIGSIVDSVKRHKVDEVIYLVNTIPANSTPENINDEISRNEVVISTLFDYVDRIVFFSSGGRVYGQSPRDHAEFDPLDPACAYGKLKVALERVVSHCASIKSKRYLIVRPSNPFGRFQNLNGKQGLVAVALGKYLSGGQLEIWGTGNEVRDYIYIDDFLIMFMNIFENKNLPFNVFNIGSGQGFSTNDVVRIVGSLGDRSLNYNFNNEIVKVSRSVLDISRYSELFGYPDFVGLEDGIRNWFLELNVDEKGENKHGQT